MNTESREKLVEIIKLARGSMSQRAFGKLLGVSATAVQMWEKGVKIPDTENLAQIATRAGYTLEELLCCLEGKSVTETSDVNLILRQINHMPLTQVAQIVQAGAARLAAAAEALSDQPKAS
ncbi:helix-turn-helix domain-containing protein [Scytonema sp. UIC 10036]|uniref:helix-turn-helix domain-containing protein n=1 Tax=Scytonema sp. UIC 10036 TaxID=2304196 RepID=UPI00137F0F94|nr:helix-turn-helix domain-containing protein [Scytonema sp. UIC 10036]